ncbi:uncharacterized protein MELLADRAFT_91465 [Melampsora larici-populina 98AG31]|uniref:Carrier domain-containing protein n=1 Tax=Melampsora larici-populina (strain 98AG31 / pathotype 3-4-7) TaxID=747676 RepID=F4RZ55_MELLP|nr:uncharacterized protein MELLADRAFT_91465 [Melampsora larici-populina 98AG31]EGG02351.1 hypothetical protein MELLADRAFT_91465 [Melampsora larici-populina 98AG31]
MVSHLNFQHFSIFVDTGNLNLIIISHLIEIQLTNRPQFDDQASLIHLPISLNLILDNIQVKFNQFCSIPSSISNRTDKSSTTVSDQSHHQTLPIRILDVAIQHPDLEVINWFDPNPSSSLPSLSISFYQLTKQAFKVSKLIKQQLNLIQNQPPQHVIGILIPKHPIIPITLLAILMTNSIYFNLDPNQPNQRLKSILNQSKISLLLHFDLQEHHSHHDNLIHQSDYHTLDLTDYFHHSVLPEISGTASIFNHRSLINNDTYLIQDDDHHELDQFFQIQDQLSFIKSNLYNLSLNSIAYYISTSGTTGIPKLIQISHFNLSQFFENYQNRFGRKLIPQSKVLQFASNSFDVHVMSIWDTLLHGATVCMTTTDSLQTDLIQAIISQSCDIIDLTPSVIWSKAGFKVKQLNTGSEYVPASLKKAFLSRGISVCVDYGPTETTVGVISSFMDSNDYQRLKSSSLDDIGIPTGSNEIYILDEDLKVVPFGEVGEICVGGNQVSPGYLDSNLNSRVFIELDLTSSLNQTQETNPRLQRIYRTGDLGRYLTDGTEGYGSIQFLGRKDSQVKVSGVRIELSEVESKLNQLHLTQPHQLRSMVVIQPKPNLGLVGFLKFNSSSPINTFPSEIYQISGKNDRIEILTPINSTQFENLINEIKQELMKELSSSMIPRQFYIINRIPLQISGKTDRGILKQLYVDFQTQQNQLIPNQHLNQHLDCNSNSNPNSVEELVSEAWKSSLGLPKEYQFKSTDDFIRLGGDSISLMKLIGKIRKEGYLINYSSFSNPNSLNFQSFIDVLKLESQVENQVGEVYKEFDLLDSRRKEDWMGFLNESYSISSNEIEDLLPTSPAQNSILSSSIGTDLYFAQAIYDLSDYDLQSLRIALIEMIKFHTMFRTRFYLHPQFSIIQCIMKPSFQDYVMQEIEVIEDEDEEESNRSIETLLKSQLDSHSNYQWGDENVEIKLFHSKKNNSIKLSFSMHHSISDGWTLDLLFDELYQRCHLKATDQVPLMVTPYGEFVKASINQRTTLEAKKYWEMYLDQLNPITWPTKPTEALRTSQHISTTWYDPNQSLLQLSKSYSFTPAIATRIATAIGIFQWTGDHQAPQDLIMGIVRSGREIGLNGRSIAEEVRGCCVKVLPSRIQCYEDKPIEEMIQEELEHESKLKSMDQTDVKESLMVEGLCKVLFTYQVGILYKPMKVRMGSIFGISIEISPNEVMDSFEIEIYYDEKFLMNPKKLLDEILNSLDRLKKVKVEEIGLGLSDSDPTEKIEMENVLKKAWVEVLGVQVTNINGQSRFRNLGGDSIGMMRLSQILKGFGYGFGSCEWIKIIKNDQFDEMLKALKKI